jgi:hypothetical protein
MNFKRNYAGIQYIQYCGLGWVDIGIGTKVPSGSVTYLSKVTKINEKSVLTQ